MMKQARVGVVLTAVLVLSVSAMYAQGVGGISPRAFGDKSLRAPVATFALLLPLTSNVVNDTRMVIDELTWYVWDGDSWNPASGGSGSVGPEGPPGPPGENGADGADGLAATITVGTALTGEPGTDVVIDNSGTENAAVLDFTIPRGAQGVQGVQGVQGIQGVQGEQGETGLQGEQGLQGIQGTQGPQGEIGPEGPQGVQGLTGDQGLEGEQGIQGIPGVDGNDGTNGVDGVDGVDGQPRQVQNDTIDLTVRDKVNFTGNAVDCVDNVGQLRTDCTITDTDTNSGGTVTSISGPSEISWATATTTPVATWANQTQAKVLASPATSTGAPSFRALVATDIPVLDHGTLTGLTDDDHAQYSLLIGRSGGQTLIGGTGATDDLILDGSGGTAGSTVVTETGAIGLPDGSAIAPGLFFTVDVNSGIFHTAGSDDNILRFAMNGTQRFAMDTVNSGRFYNSSGNAGINGMTASATVPPVCPDLVNDSNTGIGRAGADDLRSIAGGVSAQGYTSTVVTTYVKTAHASQPFTVVDNGTPVTRAISTLTPTTSFAKLTCSDSDGCDITLSETGAVDGQRLNIINVSANVCGFADTSGVTEMGIGTLDLGQWDSLEFLYVTDRWVQVSNSNN